MNTGLLDAAHHALRTAVGSLDDADWTAATPCTDWNVAQVLRHAVLDQHAFAVAIAGGQHPQENQFAPAAARPDDPHGYLEAGLTRAAAAFASVDPADEAVPTPWPGAMTAELVQAACALDAAVHAWDMAVASGLSSPLTPDCAARLLVAAPAFVEPLRAFYGSALPPQAGDDPTAALLRYLGRDPSWTRAR